MLSYIVRRLLILPLVLLGVTVMVFGMFQTLDPYKKATIYIQDPTQLRGGGQEVFEKIIERYGLNDPLPIQYWRWLKNIIHGKWGYSETAHRPVLQAVGYYLPATAELALLAIIPVVFMGIWLGVISAINQNNPIDQGTRIMAITGWSFPTFVFGLIVLMVFYGRLGWFPPGRLSHWASDIVHSSSFIRYTGMNTIDALLNGNLRVLGDALRHMVLPVITLSYVSWALILRITRSSMLETLRQDYVTTARSKGLKEKVVIRKHARRNALIPVATIAGLMVAGLMHGVVITETIFNYHGVGRFAANAALHLDIPAVLGFALFNGILMVVANLVVDVMYAIIDPRVRLG